MKSRSLRYFGMGVGIILICTLAIFLFIKPLMVADFRGEPVEVYSLSALIVSFFLKTISVLGLYYILRGFMIRYPQTIGRGTLIYKVAIVFLFFVIFVNMMELALKGIFSEDALRDEVENYQNPNHT